MSRKAVLFESLQRFYKEGDHLEQFTRHTSKRAEQTISLRLLDWLVTNYAKSKNVVYTVTDPDTGSEKTFNVYMEYKAQLKAYSKRFFDPFCRRERVEIVNHDGVPQETTVGQLNFLRWCIKSGVVRFALDNRELIEADMVCVSKMRPKTHDGKRQELSRAAIKACTKTYCHVTVRF